MRKLIYIFGPANCGSTLLTTLLAQHSEIATVGELKATAIRDIENYRCSCGLLLLECGFWGEVQIACQRRGIELDLRNFRTHFRGQSWLADRAIGTGVRNPNLERLRGLVLTLYPPARRTLHENLERNCGIIDSICETARKPVFLDASKDPIRLLHFLRSGLFDVRAIHLVRDGRAILASYKKRNPDVDHNFAAWKAKVVECENVRLLISDVRLHTLRYEDLCADVPGTLSALFRVVGVADEAGRCHAAAASDSQHIIGHNSRLSGDRSVKVRQEWSTILSVPDLVNFRSHGERLNRLYGYGESAAFQKPA